MSQVQTIKPTDSRNIAKVQFNGEKMRIHFHSGAVYDYSGETIGAVFANMRDAVDKGESAGSFFHKNVRGVAGITATKVEAADKGAPAPDLSDNEDVVVQVQEEDAELDRPTADGNRS